MSASEIRIDHVSRYSYAEPAAGIIELMKLTPRDSDCQQIVDWRLDIDVDGRLMSARDAHANIVHIFYADRPVDTLTIRVSGRAIRQDSAGLVRGTVEPLPLAAFLRSTPLTEATPPIQAFAANFADRPPLDALHALSLAVGERLTFEPGITDTWTDADAAFRMGRGVCQDLAQVFIAAARTLGHPARYVSGHFAPPGHPEQEAAHAWAEAFVPDLGWVAFDPTHGVSATEHHLRVAVGLDSLEAAPIRGTRRGGGAERLDVEVHGQTVPHQQPQQWQQQSG